MTTTPISSKRSFLKRSAGLTAVLGTLSGTALAAATPAKTRTKNEFRVSSGFVSDPMTYFDVIEPIRPTGKPPVLLIPGGGHTGASFMNTVDGRQGWAYNFAAMGHKVIVVDWAGTGRSGYIPASMITGELVVRGLGKVLATLDKPAVLVTHSMSGPFGWKLMELHPDRVASIVAIAPGGPGNLAPATQLVAETPEYVEARLTPEAPVIRLSRKDPFVSPRGFSLKKLIGDGSRFPKDKVEPYLGTLISVPPLLLLERFDIGNTALRINNFDGFKGKKVALIIGTDDVDHTEALDKPIVDWLNKNGARAEFIQLGEKGIKGNGHMMMIEDNSEQLAGAIATWIQSGHFPSRS